MGSLVRGVLCWPAVVALLLAAVYVASAAFVPQEDFGTSCDGTAFAFVSDDHLSNPLAIARAAYLSLVPFFHLLLSSKIYYYYY